MRDYLLRLYSFLLSCSQTKWALYTLSAVAFAESSFFIIPPDFLLVPISLSNPKKSFIYASICGVFSVLGGILGYCIGYLLFKYVGTKLITYFSYQEQFSTFTNLYNKHNALAVFLGGFTPIPYKLITLFSGFSQSNFIEFLIASILARFSRFYIIATIIYFFGEQAKSVIEKHIWKVTLIMSIIVVAVAVYLITKS